ncbi:hypothetical protein CPB84DRAFT_1767473 [Gymnopilus junonius]|uniref:Uncharacterized protein n=1 Tax=Gymnopilus junonius TaxID=109634 RepID=A0A9P5TSS9_GYMJU|nr:hypothetical protein CPB84DRAFT_1767473 [Gymnopilus junonius]
MPNMLDHVFSDRLAPCIPVKRPPLSLLGMDGKEVRSLNVKGSAILRAMIMNSGLDLSHDEAILQLTRSLCTLQITTFLNLQFLPNGQLVQFRSWLDRPHWRHVATRLSSMPPFLFQNGSGGIRNQVCRVSSATAVRLGTRTTPRPNGARLE